MVTVILTHEVKDFANWKSMFEAGESLRSGAGIKTLGIYTATDNPNRVTVITEFPGAEAVHGFLNNPQLKSTMEQAGVVGSPDVKVLNKAD